MRRGRHIAVWRVAVGSAATAAVFMIGVFYLQVGARAEGVAAIACGIAAFGIVAGATLSRPLLARRAVAGLFLAWTVFGLTVAVTDDLGTGLVMITAGIGAAGFIVAILPGEDVRIARIVTGAGAVMVAAGVLMAVTTSLVAGGGLVGLGWYELWALPRLRMRLRRESESQNEPLQTPYRPGGAPLFPPR